MNLDLGRARRSVAAATCLLLVSACAIDEEFRTPDGKAPSKDAIAAYVDSRAAAPHDGGVAKEPLALIDALDLVGDGSTDLAQVRAQVLQARANVDLARSALLPKFAIGASVLAYAKPQGTAGFFQRDAEIFDLNVEFSIPLDLTGRLKESVRAAQARYRAQKSRESAALREQRFLAATAFFGLSEALELRDVVASSIAAQEKELQDARTRLSAGVLRKNDVLTAEVVLERTRHRAVEVETAIHEARRALNVATGLPVDFETRIVRMTSLRELPTDPTPMLLRSRTDNPEVATLVEVREALLHEYEVADRSSLPDVSIGPRANYTSDSLANPNFQFAGFVAASWNPDFNGEIKARTDALSAQIVENAAACTGLLRRLEARILQAHRRVVDRTSALKTAEASVASARENLRIFEAQFRAGTATAREVLEAQALLDETEGTFRTARHQANLAAFEALYVAGADMRAAALDA
jgi:outer membrane protein